MTALSAGPDWTAAQGLWQLCTLVSRSMADLVRLAAARPLSLADQIDQQPRWVVGGPAVNLLDRPKAAGRIGLPDATSASRSWRVGLHREG